MLKSGALERINLILPGDLISRTFGTGLIARSELLAFVGCGKNRNCLGRLRFSHRKSGVSLSGVPVSVRHFPEKPQRE